MSVSLGGLGWVRAVLHGRRIPAWLSVRRPKSSLSRSELAVFRQTTPDLVHLNPATHGQALAQGPAPPAAQGPAARALAICVLGVPNAGKSTLVNTLCGFTACPHSSKVHTTRQSAEIILTLDQTQLVFSDTPGVVRPADAKKFNLERNMVVHPEMSCTQADLLLVVQDVSNRYMREAIDKRILRLLCLYPHIPSVLILNKIDTIPKARRVLNLIRKLTCNRLEGQPSTVRIKPHVDRRTAESYLKSKDRSGSPEKNEHIEPPNPVEDFMRVVRTKKGELTETEIVELTNGKVGWPNFSEVFSISSVTQEGIANFRDYLLGLAPERPWQYSDKIKTKSDPKDVVKRTIKAKLLEVLPNEIPYALEPEIESWHYENGTLRIGILIHAKKERYSAYLMSAGGQDIKTFAKLAEADLQNFFQTEVFVGVNVKLVKRKDTARPGRPPKTSPPSIDVLL
eukprot:maker-scaffold590_size129399-snap-gene-0.35 protein:Tk08102 transcript:maker-scaffold590_size129399-snap-gene-0.35-mRNA-1 annotation:"hypothetical protein DAPPUDRAFT_194445"